MSVSRGYISKRRPAKLVFRLSAAGRVTIVVQQLAPVCGVVGRLHVTGRRGLNRISLRPRVGRKVLGPGTYRFFVRPRGERRGKSVTVVVVPGGAPSRAEVASARRENVCGAVSGEQGAAGDDAALLASSSGGSARDARGAFQPPSRESQGSVKAAGGVSTGGGSLLPNPIAQAAPLLNPAEGPRAWLKMLLLAGFGAAALLLAAAAIPAAMTRTSRTGEAVARRRSEISVLGGVTLITFAIAYLLASLV